MNHLFDDFDVPPYLMAADTDPSIIPDEDDILPTDRENEADMDEIVEELHKDDIDPEELDEEEEDEDSLEDEDEDSSEED